MRFSATRVAIAGHSGVGKTTTALLIRAHLGEAMIRHCSNHLKERAKNYNISAPYPVTLHRHIDAETHAWMNEASRPCIVEGRYLRYVLADMADVFLVELTCDYDQRIRRATVEVGDSAALHITTSDIEDDNNQQQLYSHITPRPADLTVNTTTQAPQMVAERILARLRRTE